MKIIGKVLGVFTIFAMTLLLSGCGDDDDRSQYKFNGFYESTSMVQALASAAEPITIIGDNVSLDKMLEGFDYSKPVIASELNYNRSNIKLTGITGKGFMLKNFTVIINGQQRNIGNVSEDFEFASKEVLDFLNESLKRVVNQNNLNVQMKFSSDKDIRVEDDVRLIINFNSTFTYLK